MQGLFLFQSPPQKFLRDSCIRISMFSLLVEILGKLTDCLTSLGWNCCCGILHRAKVEEHTCSPFPNSWDRFGHYLQFPLLWAIMGVWFSGRAGSYNETWFFLFLAVQLLFSMLSWAQHSGSSPVLCSCIVCTFPCKPHALRALVAAISFQQCEDLFRTAHSDMLWNTGFHWS